MSIYNHYPTCSTNDPLLDIHEKTLQAYRDASSNNFLLFVQGLTIPSATGPQCFDDCMEDFQIECFEDLASSLHAVRDGLMPPRRRFWVERTKKAGKDSDLACCLLWLVAFPTRPLYIQVGAADRDQAAIVRRRVNDLLYYNDWLNDFVEVQTYKIKNKGGLAEIEIEAADIPGSHGEAPDVLLVNELSHVTKWEFVENLLDNADGVPQGLVIIATNAGFKGSKAEVLRRNAIESKNWQTHIWSQPAPWINKGDLEDAKRRNSPNRFKRLFWGLWVSGKGDALGEEIIDRCFKRGLQPLEAPEPGWVYIAAIDLGVSHDHSGLVVLGVHQKEQRLREAWLRGWAPSERTGEVDLMEVENACFAAFKTFRLAWFGYDPTQAKLMAQRLTRRGVPMREVSFASSKNLTAMAESLIQVVEAGKLECFEDEEGRLRRDFGKFCIVERPYGYKLEAVSDEYGHADVGTALVICLPKAMGMLAGMGGLQPEEIIANPDDDELLTEKEIEEMPSELREIYEAYDNLEDERRIRRGRDLLLDERWDRV